MQKKIDFLKTSFSISILNQLSSPFSGIFLLLSLSLSIFSVVLSITTLKIYFRSDSPEHHAGWQRVLKLRAVQASILSFFGQEDRSSEPRGTSAPPSCPAPCWKQVALQLNRYSFLLTTVLMLLCYIALFALNVNIYRRRHEICDKLIAKADSLPGTLHG